MIKRPINQKLIGKDYIGLIEADGIAAYDELKRHFGESNLLHTLRNTIAYHHRARRNSKPPLRTFLRMKTGLGILPMRSTIHFIWRPTW
jgi:hypothetical protein